MVKGARLARRITASISAAGTPRRRLLRAPALLSRPPPTCDSSRSSLRSFLQVHVGLKPSDAAHLEHRLSGVDLPGMDIKTKELSQI